MDDPQPSPSISIPGLEDQDESVRIAVKALGDMRNGNGGHRSDINSRTRSTLSSSSSTYSSNSAPKSPPLPSSSSRETHLDPSLAPTLTPPAFVSRMSHLPFVGSAMSLYEHGKASSRVVKYGAEMVESSVKSISRPVIDRLPVNVNQLDEFACRQLDRLDRYRRPSASDSLPSPASPTPGSGSSLGSRMAISPNPTPTPTPSAADRDRGRPKIKAKILEGSALADEEEEEEEEEEGDGDVDMTREGEEDYFTTSNPSSPGMSRRRKTWRDGGGERGVPGWLEATSPFVAPPPPPPSDYSQSYTHWRASTPTQNGDDDRAPQKPTTLATTGAGSTSESGAERQVAQRSRWQAVLLEAGGLSAALSEESMRRLKYCLQWLQYATAHIDAQILILRDFTASLQPLPPSSSSLPSATQRRPPISEEHMRRLTDVRRDIVHTIRQVVDVVSKYAGGALPEPARGRVRGFILKLPQRWASKAGGAGVGAGAGVGIGGAAGPGVSGPVERGVGERERERETVAAASGTGMRRTAGGQRRAAQRERGAGADGIRSGQSSRATSPAPGTSPRVGRAVLGGHGHGHARNGNGDLALAAEGVGVGGAEPKTGQGQGQVSRSAALVASQRILALATESLDMMRNVTGVVKDSLDRADAWVGRLRTVGIQRGVQEGEGEDSSEGALDTPGRTHPHPHPQDFEFAFSNRMQHRHRRTDSAQSQQSQQSVSMSMYDEHDGGGSGLPSPFFSSVSGSGSGSGSGSTVWGSSIPSTPGGSASGSGGGYSPGQVYAHANGSGNGNGNGNGKAGGYAGSPGMTAMTIPIGAMSLASASRYGTPRSGVVGLPEEEEDDGEDEEVGEGVGERVGERKVGEMEMERRGRVRVVGQDVAVGDGDGEEDGDEERRVQKMDVDG